MSAPKPCPPPRRPAPVRDPLLPSVTQRAILRSAVLTDGWAHSSPKMMATLRARGWVAGPERGSLGEQVAIRITDAGAQAAEASVPGMARDAAPRTLSRYQQWRDSQDAAAAELAQDAGEPEDVAA